MSTIEKAVEKLGQSQARSGSGREPGPAVTDALEKVGADKIVASKQVRGTAEVRETPVVQVPPQPARPRTTEKSLWELPLAQLAELGMVTPLAPRSGVAEEFRTIKRPLLRNIDGATAARVENPNLIMVTSALQGDGKTFTALNLALSIAMEQDKTVLFVDADVAKASAGRLLGIPSAQPGLIDVLEKKGVNLGDVILPTSIDNLRILPAGNVHERATELLASGSMRELMIEMGGRYPDRVVVFDSPPLLLTTEASVLASFMGQIAFVVSTDETPSEAVTEALEHIGDDKIIGMVLNKAHRRRNKFMGISYGSRYGYGYGYGYGDRRHADAAEQAD
jgi:protein-tyrosine kinase